MTTLNLLYAKEIPVSSGISVRIPTVGEILEREDEYKDLVAAFTAVPMDLMLQLDKLGIDFTRLSDWDLFLLLFGGIKDMDTSLGFGDLDFSRFRFFDGAFHYPTGAVIDKGTHALIAAAFRKILGLKRNSRRPANEDAKKYLLDNARRREKSRPKTVESSLEKDIVALCCSPEFKYDYEGVLTMSVYRFTVSRRQIVRRVNYQGVSTGIFTGNLQLKDVPAAERTWI